MSRLSGFFTASIRRRILTSFAVVMLLVVVTAVSGFYQLTQVVRSATEMVPASARMGTLQDLALAISALDADLERLFVISGIQFQEAIVEDLEAMRTALQAMQEGGEETVQPLVQEMEQAQVALDGEVRALIEAESGDLSTREINERILSVYTRIDDVKELHGELTAETQAKLSESVVEQERAATRVMVQFLLLSLGVLVVSVLSSVFVTSSIATPLASLANTAGRIADGELGLEPEVTREDEIGVLAQAFRRMTAQLRTLIGGLEQRVAERTAELERRSRYLEATASVARDAASILEIEELLARTAVLISERFGFYHAGIFLLEASGEWAVLQAASSEGGQRMLDRGHRLRRGVGIVGRVAQEGAPRITLDVGADAAFFDNPDLPETRTEVALPLRAGGEVIGVLDVQSREPGAASEEDVSALQTLADQVAVAISNARHFAEREQALDAAQRAYGELSWEAWVQMLRAQSGLGFASSRQAVVPARDTWTPLMKVALENGQIERDEDSAALAIPIKVRGRVIGVIDGKKRDGSGRWTEEEVTLMQTFAEQSAVALESARLYQASQRRAAEERLIGEVTARMRETLDLDTVLVTAAQEIRRALGLSKLTVQLAAESDRPGTGPAGDGTRVSDKGGEE